MSARPLTHRLFALLMGVLALRLTLWGASVACATPAWMAASLGNAPAMAVAAMAVGEPGARAGMAGMQHDHVQGAHRTPTVAVADGSSEAAATPAPAPDCPMGLAATDCGASLCATVPPAVGAQVAAASPARVVGPVTWSLDLHGPTRSLAPDVPPPKA